MKTIIIATKNKGKIKELIDAFADLPVNIKSLAEFPDLPEAVEDGSTFAENALIKARFYSEKTGAACIADDSGLEIDILDKKPGVYSARFAGEQATDAENNNKMIEEIRKKQVSESSARYKCVLVFHDVDGKILQADGSCEGSIKLQAQGTNGFGYDPYFYIKDKTMAQMTLAEKNAVSHRGLAIKKMKVLLAEYLL